MSIFVAHGAEKFPVSKCIWVTCPKCRKLFYIHSMFYTTYPKVKLECPSCGASFRKEDSPKTFGAPH